MSTLTCPNCKGKVEYNRGRCRITPKGTDIPIGSSIWIFRCTQCGAHAIIDARKNNRDNAYKAFRSDVLGEQSDSQSRAPVPERRVEQRPLQTTQSVQHSGGSDTSPKISHPPSEIKKLLAECGCPEEHQSSKLVKILSSQVEKPVHYTFLDATEPEYGTYVESLDIPTELKKTLNDDFDKLYSFQSEAFDKIMQGSDVVIEAPTGQGKTEAFILPILKQLSDNPGSGIRVLLMYPTNALARDQYEKISAYANAVNLRVAIFNGTISKEERQRTVFDDPPDILLTNVDILHYHLGRGSYYSDLRPLLNTVKHIVLDEIHRYTGAFGSNVYYILKRLQMEATDRIQLIGSSATISNPQEFASKLFGGDCELVRSKKAKRGPTHSLMYHPSTRTSETMMRDLVKNLVDGRFHPLVFANSHKTAENINMLLRYAGLRSNVHRAGILPRLRQVSEEEFRSKQISALVATPTLELGIDIGSVDSVVSMMVGTTRLLQRFGRAGRKGQVSIAVVALKKDSPISLYYRKYPEKFMGDIDPAYLEIENDIVLEYQTIAAVLGGRLHLTSIPEMKEEIHRLERQELVSIDNDGLVRPLQRRFLVDILQPYSIRGIGEEVEIRMESEKIGERNMPMAARELHPGAIYIHNGDLYTSYRLDDDFGHWQAQVRHIQETQERTDANFFVKPRIINIHEERNVFGIQVKYCSLEIEQVVHSYTIYNRLTNEKVGFRLLSPTIDYYYRTRGIVFEVPAPDIATSSESDFSTKFGHIEDEKDIPKASFHALTHVLAEASGMFTGGGENDIEGLCVGDSGIIVLYDTGPGGTGASKILHDNLEEAFKRVYDILKSCECGQPNGCPYCVMRLRCSKNNGLLSKYGARDCIEKILDGHETELTDSSLSGYGVII